MTICIVCGETAEEGHRCEIMRHAEKTDEIEKNRGRLVRSPNAFGGDLNWVPCSSDGSEDGATEELAKQLFLAYWREFYPETAEVRWDQMAGRSRSGWQAVALFVRAEFHAMLQRRPRPAPIAIRKGKREPDVLPDGRRLR